MTILVTGGAGYIGGHTTLALLDRGFHPVIQDELGWKPQFDNLSTIVEHACNWELALAKRPTVLNNQLGICI